MFSLLSGVVIRRPGLVVLSWLALAVVLYQFGPRWDQVTKDDDVRFFPPDSLSVIGQDLLEQGFPRDASSSQLVLVYERAHGHVTPDDLRYVEDAASKLFQLAQSHPEFGIDKRPDTPLTPVIGPRLIGTSSDGKGQAALAIVRFNGTYLSKKTRVAVDRIFEWVDQQRPGLPSGLELVLTGSAVVGHDTNAAANESIKNTTDSTIALVVVILLVVYRSPLLAMIPLVTIALSVFVSLRLIALLTLIPGLGFQVINITQVFVVVVLFGAGTDYCLFLIARYREELKRGRTRPDALTQAIRQVGAALVASAGTVIVGLGMLFFSSFAKVKFTGPTIALSLAVALVAALTLAPAMLVLLGAGTDYLLRRIDPYREKVLLRWAMVWLRGARRQNNRERPDIASDDQGLDGFWGRVAGLVVDYPLTILVVCLVVLAPLAVAGARTRSNHNQLSDLDPSSPSKIGANAVRRYFAVGELSPALVLVHNPVLDFRSPEGRQAVAQVNRRLLQISNVAEVRSLAQPLGQAAGTRTEGGFFNRLADQVVNKAVESRYVSTAPASPSDRNHITRFDVVLKSDPFSESSSQTLEQVRDVLTAAAAPGEVLAGSVAIGIAGSTSAVHDLKTVTSSDQRKMYVLVTLGVYVVLVILLRRPGICLYLIATVVLGYLASLGLTDLLFRALDQSPGPWTGLDWTVAFFLFVILVAVGEDYNILLMARVIEEERIHGTTEGTRRAVAHTGGIISSCGLIMAGTFGSMLTGTLNSLRELGFALGLGVLLDTFLVRPILVPAFVILWARIPFGRRARIRHEQDEALISSRAEIS